jgi:hypothetical protein
MGMERLRPPPRISLPPPLSLSVPPLPPRLSFLPNNLVFSGKGQNNVLVDEPPSGLSVSVEDLLVLEMGLSSKDPAFDATLAKVRRHPRHCL